MEKYRRELKKDLSEIEDEDDDIDIDAMFDGAGTGEEEEEAAVGCTCESFATVWEEDAGCRGVASSFCWSSASS